MSCDKPISISQLAFQKFVSCHHSKYMTINPSSSYVTHFPDESITCPDAISWMTSVWILSNPPRWLVLAYECQRVYCIGVYSGGYAVSRVKANYEDIYIPVLTISTKTFPPFTISLTDQKNTRSNCWASALSSFWQVWTTSLRCSIECKLFVTSSCGHVTTFLKLDIVIGGGKCLLCWWLIMRIIDLFFSEGCIGHLLDLYIDLLI